MSTAITETPITWTPPDYIICCTEGVWSCVDGHRPGQILFGDHQYEDGTLVPNTPQGVLQACIDAAEDWDALAAARAHAEG